jgi:hypothetical protein
VVAHQLPAVAQDLVEQQANLVRAPAHPPPHQAMEALMEAVVVVELLIKLENFTKPVLAQMVQLELYGAQTGLSRPQTQVICNSKF